MLSRQIHCQQHSYGIDIHDIRFQKKEKKKVVTRGQGDLM